MSESYQINTMMTAPVNGMYVSDPKRWLIAEIVAKIMNTTLSKIIGVYDTDAKIIACYHEILFGELKYQEVAKKYSINRTYLSIRLSRLGDRLTEDPELKIKMKSIGRLLLKIEVNNKSHG